MFNSVVFPGDEKIKLYIIFTPTHAKLFYEWFFPTLRDDYDLVIRRIPQECETGTFMHEGWTSTTLRKVKFIIDAIKENWNKIFIYSDVDVQFFKKTKKVILDCMENIDLIIQKNDPSGQLCTGFFACRGNEKTLNLWLDVQRFMENNQRISDQISLNTVIQESKNKEVKWSYLPTEFLGGGTLSGKRWHPGDSIEIPENILLHHANWTRGIYNKILQLNYVRNIVETRSQNKTKQQG